MTGIEALKKQSLFSWISNAPLEFLVENAKTETLKDGEVIYKAGSNGSAVYLIMSGSVEFKPDSGDCITLAAGNLFGECSVIELKQRTSEAKAKGETSILILTHEVLYQFSQKFPDPYSIVITNLARCLAARIRDLNEKKATTTKTPQEELSDER